MINAGNAVVFHDHAPDEACNSNCYEHKDSTVGKPWRYFLRIDGTLREVYPLTKPSKENRGTVKVEVSRSGEVLTVGSGSLTIHRP